MIGTLISLAITLLLILFPVKEFTEGQSTLLAGLIIGSGLLLGFMHLLVLVFTFSPLQKGEKGLTPRIVQTFKSDSLLQLGATLLIIFLFLSYAISLDLFFFHFFPTWSLIAGWTLLLGFAIDLSFHLIKRVMSFLDPYHVVSLYGHAAQKSIRRTHLQEICLWIETLTETALKSLAKDGISLTLAAIDNLREISKNFLAAAKSITFHDDPQKEGSHVGYILFYLFQRLELIFHSALKHKLEPVCSDILSTFGKIAIYSAKYDVSMAPFPLHYIGRLAVSAQLDQLPEVGNRATLTLLEAGKVILKEADVQYVSIKETFLTLLDGMHEIAEETFRKDKSIGIDMLTKPFYDLKKLFQEEKMASHPDQSAIVQRIDGILSQFATLQTVMSNLPPLHEIPKETNPFEEERV